MPILEYPYLAYPGHHINRPMAPCVAINTRNGRSREFFGILDSGADQTSLTEDVFDDLEINLEALRKITVGGAEGYAPTRFCDFIRIAFLERLSMREYFPNELYSVPLHLIHGPFSLLGRELFLDLCVVKLDGPNQIGTVTF